MAEDNKEEKYVIEGEEPHENEIDDDLKDGEGENHESEDDGGSDDEHDEGGQEAAGEDDNEREAIRARRREERRNKKENQREREEGMRRELAARDNIIKEMQDRLLLVERKSTGSEVAQIDKAIDDAANAYSYYKAQIAVGTQTLDGEVVANATENMLLAQRKFDDLNNIKRGYQNQQDKPAPLDPRLVDQAKNWMERNKWYNPAGKDMDSRIALTVDRAMAEEGWNPTTPQYWQELDSRLKKHLPHRATAVHNDNKSRSRPIVSGSGRESASSQSSGTYKLSSDRVNAMKDAGIWDDPIARNKMIATYKQLDRDSSGQR
jgi:hypothetical protein